MSSDGGNGVRPVMSVQYDVDVPLLLCKVGEYPVHHGGLFLARSAGRVGIPVAAMVENRWTPLAVSRYVDARFLPLAPDSDPGTLVGRFAQIARALGRRPVVAATDDEAAVLLDENAELLRPYARLPRQQPGLSRVVSSKAQLPSVCEKVGVGSPLTYRPESPEQLLEFARGARFPLVVKNAESFSRRSRPAVSATTVIEDERQLHRFAATLEPGTDLVVQEYIPAQERINHVYQGLRTSNGDRTISFTGVKLRDWPLGAGETTFLESRSEPSVRALGEQLLAGLDYRGVCDLDIIEDRRDNSLRVIDFNPRFGANAAAFLMANDIDLVRAYHLDLTGRTIPLAAQIDHRTFEVERGDRLARQALGIADAPPPTVTAWHALDDRRPATVMWARAMMSAVRTRLRA